MGTRARINVVEDGETLVSIYRQYDGYPSGLGKEVAEFLSGLSLVNGFGLDRTGLANGMGCLAAQLIGHIKTEAGNVYIRNTGPDSHGEEYIYTVYERGTGKLSQICMRVAAGGMTAFGCPGDSESDMWTLYDGPVSGFDAEDIDACQQELINKASRRKTRRKA